MTSQQPINRQYLQVWLLVYRKERGIQSETLSIANQPDNIPPTVIIEPTSTLPNVRWDPGTSD